MNEAAETPVPPPAAEQRTAVDAIRRRSAKSRRIAWALAAVVALLYALAFLMNR